MNIETAQIAKLELKPNDVLVVSIADKISSEAGQRLRAHLEDSLPGGTRLMILSNGATLSAVSQVKPESLATDADFGSQLVKALGLPDRCTSIDLHAEAGDVVTVTSKHYVLQPEPEFFSMIENEFELVRKTNKAQPAEFSFSAWLADRKAAAHDALMQRCRDLSVMDARMAVPA